MAKIGKKAPAEGQVNLQGDDIGLSPLPEKIPENPHTIFFGLCPLETASDTGHYYAGSSNSFWKLLHRSKLVPKELLPEQDDELLHFGFGLADLTSNPARGSAHLTRVETIKSKERVHQVARKYSPRVIAFVGKSVFEHYRRHRAGNFKVGFQDFKIEGAAVFVLWTPSGANATRLEDRLPSYDELRDFLDATRPS